jgi:HAD superfamily phosphoserine phosphatase-like hydrolase
MGFEKQLLLVDFDETLICENTLIPLYRLSTDKPLWRLAWRALKSQRWRKVGFHSAMKEHMYHAILANVSEADLLKRTHTLAQRISVNQAVWKQINALINEGARIIVVTASLHLVVEAVLKEKGIWVDEVVGTNAKIQYGIFTGELLGRECVGTAKGERVQALLNKYKDYKVTAFGNLPADRTMLEQVDHAFVVRGSRISSYH